MGGCSGPRDETRLISFTVVLDIMALHFSNQKKECIRNRKKKEKAMRARDDEIEIKKEWRNGKKDDDDYGKYTCRVGLSQK